MGGRTPLFVLLTFSLVVLRIELEISYGCRETERKALIVFKRGLHDPSNRLSSWVGEDCCAWEGVGCSIFSGRVIKLDLRNRRCKRALRGDITPSLRSLQQLNHLDLSGNCFVGVVPDQLGNLSNLQHLHLSYNNYRDEIELISCHSRIFPCSLSHVNFTSLTTLDLRYNDINSIIPDWGFNITSLEIFYLGWNDLYGIFPYSITKFTSLRALDLSGSVGSFLNWPGNIKNLKSLYLSFNSIYGSVPTSIGDLSLLQHLFLDSNYLNRTISKGIGQLKSLVSLDLYHNSLSFNKLFTLDLGHNNFIRNIPTWIGESLLYLKTLGLRSNAFTGNIPQLSSLPSFRILDLSNNNLSGTIPQGFGNFSALKRAPMYHFLDLSRNNLSGAIPSSLVALNFLNHLNLSYNNISGKIPIGNQLQTFINPSIYAGNPNLSGPLSPKNYITK
ncbi:unnamed protein product [Musa acuminata subsp. malaccensis]|uniref:(wild Malaysian banana) hypothetical protein n=1 Tax=Musa acuminata subsp. malaccensis TaxID=214687 RepID=A0A804I1X5_MUSAM|nr:unnamed protein product [Musa acuminata subsp. malaccensis]